MVKEKSTTIDYIGVFIAVMLAVIFIGVIASLTQDTTTYTQVNNEQVSIASTRLGTLNSSFNSSVVLGPVTHYPTDWRVEDCALSSILITNASGTALTVTTDYTFDTTAGTFNLENTTTVAAAFAASNTSKVSYKYCGAGYVNSSWGRAILNTNVGFFALAILIIVIALVYLYFKEIE